jgi:hypothetical protein
MQRELNRFLLRLFLLALPVAAGFEVLYRVGIYPVLTNSQLFDYKTLEAVRHPPGEVKLLAMGSSVTLYNLDSRMLGQDLGLSYHNFASWGMQITDIGAVLHPLVREYRPSYVLICSSVRDFMSPATGSYFEYVHTADWIRERFPEYFYVRNYSPVHSLYLRRFKSRRPHFDAWGGASIAEMWQGMERNDKDEHLDFPTPDAELQYRALDSLCAYLAAEKVRLIFAQSPMEARYTNTIARQQALAAHFERCRAIVRGWGEDYFNYYDTTVFSDSLFADLTHLSKAGQEVLTGKMVTDLKRIVQK